MSDEREGASLEAERKRLRELAAKRWTSLTTPEAIEYDDLAGRLAPKLDAAMTAGEAERDKAIEEMRANDRASVEAVRLAVENALRERDEARKALSAAEAQRDDYLARLRRIAAADAIGASFYPELEGIDPEEQP